MLSRLKKNRKLYIYYLAFLFVFSVGIILIQDLGFFPQEFFPFNNEENIFEDDINISTESDTHTLQWNIAWNGPADETGYAIAIDSEDCVYFAGRTNSYGAGGYDIVLIKYDTYGNQLWNLTWGGAGDEICNALAIDSSDNIYLAGNTASFGFTTHELCLIKFNNSGSQLWNRTWGQTHGTLQNPEYGRAIVIDTNDDVYIGGYTQIRYADDTDMIIVKYNKDGDQLWNVTKDVGGYERIEGMALDSSGDLFVTGQTSYWQVAWEWDEEEHLLAKFSSSGVFQWHKMWGEFNRDDRLLSIVIDSSNYIYVSGGFTATRLIKLDSAGNVLWTRTWGSGLRYICPGMILDSSDDIYLTGWVNNVQGSNGIEGYLLKYNSLGDYQWHEFAGNTLAYGIGMDSYENIYIGGFGTENMKLAKFKAPPIIEINSPFDYQPFGSGSPNFNLTILNSDIHHKWYRLNDGNNYTLTTTVGRINQTAWEQCINGTVSIKFYVNDTLSNTVFEEVIVRKGSLLIAPPILNIIIIEPAYDGLIKLSWSKESGATKYYIFRAKSFIESIVGMEPIASTVDTNYTDTLTLPGLYYYRVIAGNSTSNSTQSNCESIELGTYIPPIHIDNTNPNRNWQKMADEKYWCTGSGTINDPYTIKNIIIRRDKTTDGIFIEQSNVYFVIKNCTILNSTSGIQLYRVTNGLIKNNTIENNYGHGIFLNYLCSSNTVMDNKLVNNTENGIYIYSTSTENTINSNTILKNHNDGITIRDYSDRNNITNNLIAENENTGINCYTDTDANQFLDNEIRDNTVHGLTLLWNSDNNLVSNNTIFGNGEYGVWLRGASLKNTISGNQIVYSGTHGIIVDRTEPSWKRLDCLIIGNNISYSGGSGIHLVDGQYLTSEKNHISNNNIGINLGGAFDFSKFFNNTIYDNINYGIYAADDDGSYADWNSFYSNYFIGNTIHARDSLANGNRWSSGTLGNYWDNYPGVDFNDDGIGDTPYQIYNEVHDNYPIWDDGDDSNPPIINILAPNPREVFGSISPNFEISIGSLYTDSLWYTILGGSQNYTFTSPTGQINQDLWDEFDNGSVFVRFYANDSLGNIGFRDLKVYKDIEAPIISIINPLSYNLYGQSPPTFNLSITDNNLNTTWYTLNDGTEYKFVSLNNRIEYEAWEACGNGTVVIKFYANDSIGNLDFEEIIVRKDIINPTIIIQNPKSRDIYGVNTIAFELIVDDPNRDSLWYNLNYGKNYTTTSLSGTIDFEAWAACGNGSIIITFYANDTVGNIAFQEVVIWKDIESPSITVLSPGQYDLFGNLPFYFEISVFDPNLMMTWYTINNGESHYFSGSTDIIDSIEWDLCQNGTVLITFYANDSLGNKDFQIITVRKDILAPVITIISPNIDDIYGSLPFNFELSIIEPNIKESWYVLNGEFTFYFSGQIGTINPSLWDLCEDGTVTVVFYVNDTVGNLAYKEIIIRKDTAPPESTLNFIPYEAPNIINRSTIISFEAFDIGDFGVEKIEYAINDSNWFIYTEPFNLSIYTNGYYLISYRAIDNGGNVEETNSMLVKLTDIEPERESITGIPGYNFYLVIIISSICVIYLYFKPIRNKKTKRYSSKSQI